MRIAFTHNLQLSGSEDEAEFDRPETVTAIAQALRRLGHEVEPIDVDGPASRVVARLEALSPDLVFNTAEGRHGRFREAFFPALFDRLSIPFTGSDAYVCAITLDKQLTKMIVAAHGVPVPGSMLITNAEQLREVQKRKLRYPLIVKPNYEGSSMGITQDCVVTDAKALLVQVEAMLTRFRAGVIVEEYIDGDDLTVPFLEKASPKSKGVLEPAQYRFARIGDEKRRYSIYDYDMKALYYDDVEVVVPANITPEQRAKAMELTRSVIGALGIRDAARIDFRLSREGELFFIEVNALPSFEPGASIYTSAELAGFDSVDKVMAAIIASASERFGINVQRRKRHLKRGKVRVGLIFNLRRVDNALEHNGDQEVEYDSPETVTAISEAVASYGHEVVELEATRELPSILPSAGIDIAFNIAEGLEGRTRESQVPALLELLGIPYTGSDPTTLSISHDKVLAKRLVSEAGLRTPPFFMMTSGKERLPKGFSFPAIIKPVAEGSSKGIIKTSVVENEAMLREVALESIGRYRQAVIAESFLAGREFTVALLGERRPRALPPMEVVFLEKDRRYPIYSYESKFFEKSVRFDTAADIPQEMRLDLERMAKSVFSVLGCRDFARVDVRLDEQGKVGFIECNPLPGLAPGFSDFCVIADAVGLNYRALIGEIMAPALRRLREKQRERIFEARH